MLYGNYNCCLVETEAEERDGWTEPCPLWGEAPSDGNVVVYIPLDQLKDVLINEEFSELIQFPFRMCSIIRMGMLLGIRRLLPEISVCWVAFMLCISRSSIYNSFDTNSKDKFWFHFACSSKTSDRQLVGCLGSKDKRSSWIKWQWRLGTVYLLNGGCNVWVLSSRGSRWIKRVLTHWPSALKSLKWN